MSGWLANIGQKLERTTITDHTKTAAGLAAAAKAAEAEASSGAGGASKIRGEGGSAARAHTADMANVDPTDSVRWAALERVRSGKLGATAVWRGEAGALTRPLFTSTSAGLTLKLHANTSVSHKGRL